MFQSHYHQGTVGASGCFRQVIHRNCRVDLDLTQSDKGSSIFKNRIYEMVQDDYESITETNGPETSVEINGLDPGQTMVIVVTVVNAEGEGPSSESYVVTIPEESGTDPTMVLVISFIAVLTIGVLVMFYLARRKKEERLGVPYPIPSVASPIDDVSPDQASGIDPPSMED